MSSLWSHFLSRDANTPLPRTALLRFQQIFWKSLKARDHSWFDFLKIWLKLRSYFIGVYEKIWSARGFVRRMGCCGTQRETYKTKENEQGKQMSKRSSSSSASRNIALEKRWAQKANLGSKTLPRVPPTAAPSPSQRQGRFGTFWAVQLAVRAGTSWDRSGMFFRGTATAEEAGAGSGHRESQAWTAAIVCASTNIACGRTFWT